MLFALRSLSLTQRILRFFWDLLAMNLYLSHILFNFFYLLGSVTEYHGSSLNFGD